jgi:hypothetical protein
MRLTIKEIVRRLRSYKPVNRKSLHWELKRLLGVRCKKIGQGLDRKVYEIVGYPLVVKIQMANSFADQTSAERYAHKRITSSKRKYRTIKKYMPKIYYANVKSGIILMRKYEVMWEKDVSDACFEIENNLKKTDCGDTDLHQRNIGKDRFGNYKIIDLGLFFNEC